MGIEIEYPLGHASSGDTLFRDTGTFLDLFERNSKNVKKIPETRTFKNNWVERNFCLVNND